MYNLSAAEIVERIAPLGMAACDYLADAYQRHLDEHFEVARKADRSMLTEADTGVHKLLLQGLKALFPNIPVCSEEGRLHDYHERDNWSWYWLVDPLDGTREFVEKTGEFSINIALMHNGTPWLGFIFLPIGKHVFVGGKTLAPRYATADLQWREPPQEADENTVVIVASSRNVKHPRIEKIASILQARNNTVAIKVVGSALKYCALLSYKWALYPRYGHTGHWDTAAGQALVEASGGLVLDMQGQQLTYPAEKLLNPSFISMSAACVPDRALLLELFGMTLE